MSLWQVLAKILETILLSTYAILQKLRRRQDFIGHLSFEIMTAAKLQNRCYSAFQWGRVSGPATWSWRSIKGVTSELPGNKWRRFRVFSCAEFLVSLLIMIITGCLVGAWGR